MPNPDASYQKPGLEGPLLNVLHGLFQGLGYKTVTQIWAFLSIFNYWISKGEQKRLQEALNFFSAIQQARIFQIFLNFDQAPLICGDDVPVWRRAKFDGRPRFFFLCCYYYLIYCIDEQVKSKGVEFWLFSIRCPDYLKKPFSFSELIFRFPVCSGAKDINFLYKICKNVHQNGKHSHVDGVSPPNFKNCGILYFNSFFELSVQKQSDDNKIFIDLPGRKCTQGAELGVVGSLRHQCQNQTRYSCQLKWAENKRKIKKYYKIGDLGESERRRWRVEGRAFIKCLEITYKCPFLIHKIYLKCLQKDIMLL